jgi:hypothetical protein
MRSYYLSPFLLGGAVGANVNNPDAWDLGPTVTGDGLELIFNRTENPFVNEEASLWVFDAVNPTRLVAQELVGCHLFMNGWKNDHFPNWRICQSDDTRL